MSNGTDRALVQFLPALVEIWWARESCQVHQDQSVLDIVQNIHMSFSHFFTDTQWPNEAIVALPKAIAMEWRPTG